MASKVKYAVFTQVFGEWRHEGFVHADGDEAEQRIKDMKEVCEKENGKDTFRTIAFLDEPHKDTRTEHDKLATGLLQAD